MFIASPGHDLICSDYSAIEAVVLAALSGEQWRLDVFNTHGRIYETSGSKIGGVSFETLIEYKKSTGQHHPLRKLGKTAELASGYQGWLGAWKAFNADSFMSEDEIEQAILAWRAASPMIVEMWGGQPNWKRDEYYGLEGMAILAVMNPGVTYDFRGISYVVKQNILYCRLLSGRYLVYHKPCLQINHERNDSYQLSFEGYNSNPNNGSIGWIRMPTYGGKLTENVVQATARDILAEAIVKLEKANYPVVLHVHDEIVSEIPENFGSIEEFENIMSQPPMWAYNWPIKASGGWRAKRYGK
jgi:DNA polymerase